MVKWNFIYGRFSRENTFFFPSKRAGKKIAGIAVVASDLSILLPANSVISNPLFEKVLSEDSPFICLRQKNPNLTEED